MTTVQTAQAALALLAQETINFANNDKASSTLVQYESCWKRFLGFCETFNLSSIPADISTVSLFLTQLAKEGKAVTTINTYAATIKYFNSRHGHYIDFNNHVLSSVVSGIKRTIGTKSHGSDAILPEDLKVLVCSCSSGATGIRDKAILLLGFSGAMRRSEMTALTVDDIKFVKEGMIVKINKSKTDQTGNGCEIAIPFSEDIHMCPVIALRRLVRIVESGYLFRRIRKNGVIGTEPLSDISVWRIITDLAEKNGLSGKITPHSLRSGFCTAASKNNARMDKIAAHARHTNIQTTMRYIRNAKKFEDHAATGIL